MWNISKSTVFTFSEIKPIKFALAMHPDLESYCYVCNTIFRIF